MQRRLEVRRPVMTLGELIVKKRGEKGIGQRQLAKLIIKEDGKHISAAYLNDIEHNRRSPTSDHILGQIAKVLDIEPMVLYFVTKRIPPSAYSKPVDEEIMVAALRALERTIKEGAQAA
jgi:transcriptional regulator with XRE-family HTH domain